MKTINESYDVVKIEAVQQHPENAREGDVDLIAESVEVNGFYGALIVQKSSGYILAGNHRWLAARAAGMTEIPVIFVEVDDDEARRVMLADNKTSDVGTYRDKGLARLLEKVKGASGSLQGSGYTQDELSEIIRRANRGSGKDLGGSSGGDGASGTDPKPFTDAEGAERLRLQYGTDLGQLWEIKGKAGIHKILVADALDPVSHVRLLGPFSQGDDDDPRGRVKLIVTDPPYALFGGSTGTADDIADDRMVRPFFERLFRAMRERLGLFGHAYVFCDWRSWSSIWDTSRRERMSAKNMLIWDKAGGRGSNYMFGHEIVGFFHKLPPQTAMGSQRSGVRPVHAVNIFRVNRVTGDERKHNAAKPVPLLSEFIKNSSDAGDLVLDFFLGSGSTMAAAEQLGRVCYGFDLEPKYAAVTLDRMVSLGCTVRKVEDAPEISAAAAKAA